MNGLLLNGYCWELILGPKPLNIRWGAGDEYCIQTLLRKKKKNDLNDQDFWKIIYRPNPQTHGEMKDLRKTLIA